MNAIWTRLRESQFTKAVTFIGLGVALAQLINISIMPVLARLYSPSNFGNLAVYLAIVTSVTPIVSGKYELAIVIEKSNKNSIQLLHIALWFIATVTLLTIGLVLSFSEIMIELTNAHSLGLWLYLTPLSLAVFGLVTPFNCLANRHKEYQVISVSKVLMALIASASAVGFGLFGINQGLIISNLLGSIAICVWLIYRYRTNLNIKEIKWNSRKSYLFQKYKSLPIFNATSSFLDGFTSALPILLLSRYFSSEIVGYYALMLRVSMVPFGFFSFAVSQVNLKKVAELTNQNLKVTPYLLKISLVLIICVVPAFFFLSLVAQPLFSWVFGSEWIFAGMYLQILFPAFALKLIVSTISTTLSATGHNQLGALWKISAFILTFFIYTFYAPKVDIDGMLMVMLVTDLGLYIFYFGLIVFSSLRPRKY